MILLLGADGFIGQAFSRELGLRRACFVPLSRDTLDFSRFEILFEYVRRLAPQFIINASADAGRSGRNGMDGEQARLEALQVNTLLPQSIARVCRSTNTPLGHVSSGCIYTGAKLLSDGVLRIEPELNQPHLRKLFESRPERFFGFTEEDAPNASFRNPPCTFLEGTKALAEEALRDCPRTYIWRARRPFNEMNEPANFLAKIQRAIRVRDEITSLTHVRDFVRACLDLWESNAPFGVYNVVNPGAVSTRRIVDMIQFILKPDREFQFSSGNRRGRNSDPSRSSCILDSSKLVRAGIKMPALEKALEHALEHWDSPVTNRAVAKRRPATNIIDLESAREFWKETSMGVVNATAPAR